MNDIAIHVENLGKQYTAGLQQRTFREFATNVSVFRSSTFWALKNINFEIKRGEIIGLIGPNGSGKSTLLRILCRITKPTQGRVIIRGQVGSLLDLGVGFHRELTARENVYLCAVILGMKKAKVCSKFDAIVDFSGTEKFIDIPIKYFSRGMKLRLAFAISAHLDSDILLVDEALAIIDAEFLDKCLSVMSGMVKNGRTILLASHNLSMVESLCPNSILLNKGRLKGFGVSKDMIKDYLRVDLDKDV